MTVGSIDSAAQMGIDWVGTPRPSVAPEAPDTRWLDRRADQIRDRVEISSLARRKQAGEEDAKVPGGKDVKELEKREKDVKAHEQAHMAAGAGVVQGGAKYSYEAGPDGKRYVSGGDVQVSVSVDSADPSRTLQQAQRAQQAALAPSAPSPQDRAAAAQASQMAAQASQELSRQQIQVGTDVVAKDTDAKRSLAQAQGMAAYSRAQVPSAHSGVSWIG